MDLQMAFNTIVNTVAVTPLTKQDRLNVEEALQIVVTNLNDYDMLKKKVKEAKEAAKALPTEKSAGDEKPEKK